MTGANPPYVVVSPDGRRDRRGSGRHRVVLAVALLAVLLVGGIGLLMVASGGRSAPWPPRGWLLVLCDVGQGDGMVLADGPHTGIVIDTGPSPAPMDECLRRLDIRHVPLLVLTHFHSDHVGGVPGVLHGRTVDRIETTTLDDPRSGADHVRAWAAAARIPVDRVRPGERRAFGAISWQVLWPDGTHQLTSTGSGIAGLGSAYPEEGSPPNNSSIVLLVDIATRTGPVRMLLTGDIEPPAQQAVLAAHPGLRVAVLKVPHHGSKYQDFDLLDSLQPRVALVSVGEHNSYGQPAPTTIGQLRTAGMPVLCTNASGSIAVFGDSSNLSVADQHGRTPAAACDLGGGHARSSSRRRGKGHGHGSQGGAGPGSGEMR